jgi:hypothetical protein
MELKLSKRMVTIKWLGKSYRTDFMQLAIILGFLMIATLASLWLPIYFATRALQSF